MSEYPVHGASRTIWAQSKGGGGQYDPILWVLLGLFWVWEIIAHFVLKNQSGHTLSNRIKAFEKLAGWPGRVLVWAALIALGVHLMGAF